MSAGPQPGIPQGGPNSHGRRRVGGMTSSSATGAVIVGASGGIGRALVGALVASRAHAPIFALSRSAASFPDGVRTCPNDLGDEATIAAAAAEVGEAGPVEMVVVATGILHGNGVSPEKTVKVLDPAAMATVFAMNTIGPALVAKHFVPLLARRVRSLFAALSARVGSIDDNRLGGWYAYRASKAALKQILRTLSRSKSPAAGRRRSSSACTRARSRPHCLGPSGRTRVQTASSSPRTARLISSAC